VQRVTARFDAPDWAVFCGRLLAAGMRACADLAEQARVRRDEPAAGAASAAADGLAGWVDQMAGAPGHAPLLAEIHKLALRAHIPLSPAPSGPGKAPGPARPPTRYGLTSREITVLRLVAAGHTNAQIGAELFISPKTASVHVTSILRKFGVSSRTHAAAVAERAGLLDGEQA
jgi:DNA-binding NarL/FixJ family response regulator